jgi:hypothetical protein
MTTTQASNDSPPIAHIGRIIRIPMGVDFENLVGIILCDDTPPPLAIDGFVGQAIPRWRVMVIAPGQDEHGQLMAISHGHLADALAQAGPLADVAASGALHDLAQAWRDTAIRAASAAGCSQRQIGREAGLSQPSVGDIVKRG